MRPKLTQVDKVCKGRRSINAYNSTLKFTSFNAQLTKNDRVRITNDHVCITNDHVCLTN